MPTQQQIEFYREKYQKFTPFKMKVSMFLSVLTNVATAPLELLKVRAQLLQEGRFLHGFGMERGVPVGKLLAEIIESGSGIKGMYTGFDTLLMRGLWLGGWRSYFWSFFYNHYNKDPRRAPHYSVGSFASFLGGFCAGVVNNPIDIVYNRQAADALYPTGHNRHYSTFFEGILKVNAERSLFRGAVASGISTGALMGSMSYFYDWMKETMYFFLGPTTYLRPIALLPTAYLGCATYLPFDNIKVRLHTMNPLPNGEMPYKGFSDCFMKVFKYECEMQKLSSIMAMHTGFAPCFLKLYTTLLTGVYLTDYAFQSFYKQGELWEGANVFTGPELGYIPHDPINHLNTNYDVMDRTVSKKYYLKHGSQSNISI